MVTLNIILRFIGNYWKDIAIGIACAVLFYISSSWWTQAAEIRGLRSQLDEAVTTEHLLREQVAAYQKASYYAQAAIEAAYKNRDKIITVLRKEINNIRQQTIPKDCNGAIEFGIKMKGDMRWPSIQ